MKKHLLAPVVLLLLLSSCKKDDQWVTASATADNTAQKARSTDGNIGKDHLKIAVLSDIHYMHKDLMNGDLKKDTAFLKDIMPNKAMQEYSIPIFGKVVSELMSEHPDILLIAGDMAKSGEEKSHRAVAELLRTLKEKGIKIYITPGNNDINSPTAYAYNNGIRTKVPNVTSTQFADIYKEFGYSNYKYKDANSLSYIAEPYPGLWILSIDAVKSLKWQTIEWIKAMMQKAKEDNVTVFGLMHYSLIEHKDEQNKVNQTSIDSSNVKADALAAAGLKVIFTGHGHVNDITMRMANSRTLYDVETGSLVTPPSAYRMMILKNKELDIDTRYITSIDAPLPGSQEFTAYSQSYLAYIMDRFFPNYLGRQLGLRADLIPEATILVRNAYMAHIAGDEKLPPLERMKINAFSNEDHGITTQTIWAMWTDVNTKDHKWHIKLTNP